MVTKERKAAFYSLYYKAPYTHRTKEGEITPPIPAKIIQNAPEQLIRGLKKGELYGNHKETFIISDYEVTKDYILILFNFTSDRYSDPNYYDRNKDTRKTVQVSDSERMEFSCHVMIKRNAKDGFSDMVVEKVPGFPKARLANLINQIFRNVKVQFPEDFRFNHPDGSIGKDNKPRQCKFKLIVIVDGVPSERMKNDIENGTIKGLELISRDKKKTWDQDGYFRETKTLTKLSFTAPSGERMARLGNFLKGVKQAQPDMEKATIRFTPPGKTNGTESANFDLADKDPTDCEHFNKTAFLNYHADHTSYDGFIKPIVDCMKKFMRIRK